MYPMKVLSLHQPWASLVALGVKTIETRSWSTNYRGPLAIHAALRQPKVGYGAEVDGWWVFPVDADLRLYSCGAAFRMPLGAIVATCTLVDVVPILAEHDESEAASWVRDFPTPAGPHAQGRWLEGGLWLIGPSPVTHGKPTPVEDQRPYGDFTPGRYAWLLADVSRLEDPVPFKGGQGLSRTWKPTGAAA